MIKAGEWDKGYLEHGNGLTGNPLTFDYAYKVQTHTHVQYKQGRNKHMGTLRHKQK